MLRRRCRQSDVFIVVAAAAGSVSVFVPHAGRSAHVCRRGDLRRGFAGFFCEQLAVQGALFEEKLPCPPQPLPKASISRKDTGEIVTVFLCGTNCGHKRCVVLGDHVSHVPLRPGSPSCPTDAVEVRYSVSGKVKLNDVGHVRCIDAPGGEIRADEHLK